MIKPERPLNKKPSRKNKPGIKKQILSIGRNPLKRSTKSKRRSGAHRPLKPEIISALIGATAAIIVAILSSPVISLKVFSALTSSTAVPTEIAAITAAPYSAEFSDIDLAGNSIPMRLVPAGKFTMGSDYGVYDGNLVQSVNLDAFYIDVYEVTNGLYEACVSAGGCQPPKSASSYTRNIYYANVDFDNYPVVNVNWHMAESYCKWRGARLPTEAQWEKAARGDLQGKAYPWGDIAPVCRKMAAGNGAKFNDKAVCDATDTEAVGSYSPNGFGLYDMAGNVWEWTGSLYRHYPYNLDDGRENLEINGPRVLRGGSWFNAEYLQRVSFRNKGYPDIFSYLIGFRCAASP